MKKHNIENYKKDLAGIFGKPIITPNGTFLQGYSRDEIIARIAKHFGYTNSEAAKFLNYCRGRKLVEVRHINSHNFEYTLNFAPDVETA